MLLFQNENLDKVVFVKLDFYNNFTNKNSIPIFREYITRLHADLEDDVAIRDLVINVLLFCNIFLKIIFQYFRSPPTCCLAQSTTLVAPSICGNF